jgi:hypothetical protein
VNVDAPNPEYPEDTAIQPSGRKKRHLAGVAFGFLAPLVGLWFAFERHATAYVVSIIVAACFPGVFLGVRSWRRWFYPDRLPARWAEDSVTYKRVRAAEWVAGVANLVAWLAVALMTLGQETSHQRARPALLAALLFCSIRVILMQYREDRKPLSPEVALPIVSPYDPSLRLTNSVRPVYSKDWN